MLEWQWIFLMAYCSILSFFFGMIADVILDKEK
jgi:hypothetical protein